VERLRPPDDLGAARAKRGVALLGLASRPAAPEARRSVRRR
jgi:hypothetical protein